MVLFEVIQTIVLILIAWFIVTQHGGTIVRVLSKQRRVILDSCALIDGRIIEIVDKGFLADELIIPQFILNELQTLADGNDSHKRERARFGLDIAHQLQDTAPTRVTIDRTVFAEAKVTDDMLVLLARKLKATLYTTDYNLGKVASVEGVPVLNVQELAQGLRPISLPGETLDIKIIQRGSNKDQGVGYLEDGTMIVVDGAVKHIGRTVPVVVTRMHQTVSGKMVFGQMRKAREPQSRQADAQSALSSGNRPANIHSAVNSRSSLPGGRSAAAKQASTPASQSLHGKLKSLRRTVQ